MKYDISNEEEIITKAKSKIRKEVTLMKKLISKDKDQTSILIR